VGPSGGVGGSLAVGAVVGVVGGRAVGAVVVVVSSTFIFHSPPSLHAIFAPGAPRRRTRSLRSGRLVGAVSPGRAVPHRVDLTGGPFARAAVGRGGVVVVEADAGVVVAGAVRTLGIELLCPKLLPSKCLDSQVS